MTQNEILTGADMIAYCLTDSAPVAAPAPVAMAYGQCENAKISTGERCGELVMLLGVVDLDSMGRPQLNTCQACEAKTAAFIAGVEAAFIEANAANPFYVEELRERQADAARRTRDLNLAAAARRFARLTTVR
jgi:hypothetical protein